MKINVPTELRITGLYDGENFKLTNVAIGKDPDSGYLNSPWLQFFADFHEGKDQVIVGGAAVTQKFKNRTDSCLNSLRRHLNAFVKEGWLDRIRD